MDTIMSGEATPAQVAGFLVALRSKGETVDEIAGLVEAMLANANPVDIGGEKLDIVGTGGDQHNTVNISTMAALVCAGAGAKVVKHGNRASSSSSGSADVLEALGVRLDLPIDRVARNAEEAGHHLLLRPGVPPFDAACRRAPPRTWRAHGVQLPGSADQPRPGRRPRPSVLPTQRMAPLVAGVLAKRGSRGLVFRGSDGLDELTTTGPSTVWEIRNGEVSEQTFDPQALGIRPATVEELRGGDAAANAAVVRDVLAGAAGAGARRRPAERRCGTGGVRRPGRGPADGPHGGGVEACRRVH